MSNDYLSDSVAWEYQRRHRRSSERKLHTRSPTVPSYAITLSPPYYWPDQQWSFSDVSAGWPYLSPDRQALSSVPSSADLWSDTSSVIAHRNDQLVPHPPRQNAGGLFESVMGPDPRGLNREEYDDIKQRISKIEDICLAIAKSGDSRNKRELADRKEQLAVKRRKRSGRTGDRDMAGAVYAQVLTDIIADILRGFSVNFVQTVIGKVVGKAF